MVVVCVVVGVVCVGVGVVCSAGVEGVVLGEVPLKVEDSETEMEMMEDCGRWGLVLVVAAVGLC